MKKVNHSILPRIDQTFWLYFISLLGLIFSLLAFWPGFMEFDSLEQYGQASGAEPLDDWYPISMALLWRALLVIHDGPEPLLILQIFLYWAGFLYLSTRLIHHTANFPLAISAVIVAFFPFLINFSGVIWKDVHLALCLFWASLLLCFGKLSRGRLIISIIFIFYGMSVRYNGLFAALPIIVLWSDRFSLLVGFRNKYRLPTLTLIVVTFYFLLSSFLVRFIPFDRYSPLNAQLLNEITYIQCQSNVRNLDFPVRYYGDKWQKIDLEIRKKLICNQVIFLANTNDTNSIFDEGFLQHPDYKDPDIKRLWIKNVSAHPLWYLKYRSIVYRTFMRLFNYTEPYYFFYDALDGQDTDSNFLRPSMRIVNPFGITRFLVEYISLSARYFHVFFRPFPWVITLFLTVVISLYKRDRVTFLIALSGLLYLFMYFFFLPSPDFRYAYYSIFAQVLAIFLLLDPHRSE